MSEKELYMKYLGVLSLLGRLTKDLSIDDQECIDRAFEDANDILKERNSQYIFKKCHPGSYALFEK